MIHDFCPYRSEALQCREALFPSGGGFLKGLMPLKEFLNLVHSMAQVFTGHVGLLSDKPGLRHRGVPRKLTHLQNWRQQRQGVIMGVVRLLLYCNKRCLLESECFDEQKP